MIRLDRKTVSFRFLLEGWYPFAVILLVVLLLYSKTAEYDFLNYDEQSLIVHNQHYLRSYGSMADVFLHGIHPQFSHFYRPVLMLTFMTDAHLFGLNPSGYHLTNLLLFVAGTWLLFVLLLKLGYLRQFALVSALLFAVHPLLVPAVAWIPGRNDLLLGALVCASFIMLIRYLDHGSVGDYAGHLLLLALALFTKETALSAVPAFTLYLLLIDRGAGRQNWKTPVAGWAALTGVFLLMQFAAIRHDDLSLRYLLRYASTAPSALIIYWGKMLWPAQLSVFPFIGDMSPRTGLICLLCVVVSLLMSRERRMRYVWFGLLWMLLFYLPTLLVNWEGIYYEHRSLVPLLGILLILGEIGACGVSTRRAVAAAALAAPLVVVLAVISFDRCPLFSNSLAFWRNAAKAAPHCSVALENLGATYLTAGNQKDALESFSAAMALEPGKARLHFEVASTLGMLGRTGEAIQEYRHTLALDSRFPNAGENLDAMERQVGARNP